MEGSASEGARPEHLEECRKIGGCPTGEARITKAYRLKAKWVIHTVGPVWSGGGRGEDERLASCYRSCFRLANENGIRSIAFPSISTGAYRFPMERAARIALGEAKGRLSGDPSIGRGVFVLFGDEAYRSYAEALAELDG